MKKKRKKERRKKRAAAFIKKSGLNIHMLTCIHDEIAFEVDDSHYTVAQKLADVMSDTITFAVPIIASPKISAKSWGDAKELKNMLKEVELHKYSYIHTFN